METPSPGEIAARVVAGLLQLAEDCAERVDELEVAVRQAVAEIDPLGARDPDPPWWPTPPGWKRLDGFTRFRSGLDRIKLLEVQTGVVISDLRGWLALRPVGTPERPVGYTPARAHAELLALATERAVLLEDMSLAERSVRADVTEATSTAVRAALRAFQGHEAAAGAQRARLSSLLGERQLAS